MPAGSDRDLVLPTLWTDAPNAAQRLRALHATGYIGHAWHQDTAFVVVNSPMLLTATWIALQDVVEGTGELAYYDASHRLPRYIFNNGRKNFDGETSNKRYAEDLERECQSRQLQHRRLLAKQGDVFFWAADLVHRSHPQTPPLWRDRLSCVTHYCPAMSMPHWFAEKEKRGIEPHFDFAGFASSFYQLPNLGETIQPIAIKEFFE